MPASIHSAVVRLPDHHASLMSSYVKREFSPIEDNTMRFHPRIEVHLEATIFYAFLIISKYPVITISMPLYSVEKH
ncbi:hypothetical protein [Prevotella corporis]|uniref:hypothetical protein n=1 Tax=Prevotella corporis TaxID=28128 RepID=UPI0023F9E8E1|nr:hypothetical protein [Prevotella corporis]